MLVPLSVVESKSSGLTIAEKSDKEKRPACSEQTLNVGKIRVLKVVRCLQNPSQDLPSTNVIAHRYSWPP